jgi:hypothetical protein
MSTAASTGPSKFSEIEFRLSGGRLQALARIATQAETPGDASGTSTEGELQLSHVGSILKSISDGVRQLEAELPRALATRDAAFRRTARASKLPLSPFLVWRRPALQRELASAERKLGEAVAQRNASWTALHFAFGQKTLAAFRNLAAAFGALEAVKAIWITNTRTCGTLSVPVSGSTLQRQAIRTSPTLPEHVESDWPGLAFRHPDGGGLELYPGFAMTGAAADQKAVSLLDINLDQGEAVVAEVSEPPADAAMVRRIWEKANKDGSPDRRYANNRSIPIVRYGLLQFSAPGLAAVIYLVSNPHAARRFAAAFADYRRCMVEEAASQASLPHREGAARATPMARTLASVPPPPVVGRAHEYTAAALVAGAVSAWLLAAGPFDDGQATAADAGPPPARTGTPTQPSSAPAVGPDTAAAAAAPVVAAAEPRPTPPVTAPATPSSQAAAQDRERIVIRSGGANIRSGPNGSADVLRTTSGGTHLNVFGRANGWVRVGDAEAWGWVHSSLLEGGN